MRVGITIIAVLAVLVVAGLAWWVSRDAGNANTPDKPSNNDPGHVANPPAADKKQSPPEPKLPEEFSSPVRFTTMTDTGVDFVHSSGITEERHFPCANGSGLASIDFDRDGHYDLYFATGNYFRKELRDPGHSNRCYQNLGAWKFRDVTKEAGLEFIAYSAGVAVGDFDADGFSDLYVTCTGENQLFRNNGDGTFEKAESSQTNDAGFAASAVFFDQDNDGLLDLYVCTYGEWEMESNVRCDDGEGRNLQLFCAPTAIEPDTDVLYRNNGDGTFANISEQLGEFKARAQGVVAADVNGDDFIDLYVGNDGDPNALYRTGQGDALVDVSDLAGVAYDREGQKQAGMGLAVSDVNRDGFVDLMVTNYANEHNALYLNRDNELFQDLSATAGVMDGAMAWIGWGVSLKDMNQDRWADLVVVNGHVEPRMFEIGHGEKYEQPARLWINENGSFRRTTSGAGEYFDSTHPSRGLVISDLDNDGDFDVVVGHQDLKPALLQNTIGGDTPRTFELRLIGSRTNRDGIGGKANLNDVDPVLSYQVIGGGSYLSADDNRLVVISETATPVEIVWPGGRRSTTPPMQPGGRYVAFEPERGRTARVLRLPE